MAEGIDLPTAQKALDDAGNLPGVEVYKDRLSVLMVGASESAASTVPPGNTYAPPRKTAFSARRSSRTSNPEAASRSRISVAAGRTATGPSRGVTSGLRHRAADARARPGDSDAFGS